VEHVLNATVRTLGDSRVPLIPQELDNEIEGTAPSTDGQQFHAKKPLIGRGLHLPHLRVQRQIALRGLLRRKEEGVAPGRVQAPNQGRLTEQEHEVPPFAIQPQGTKTSAPESGVELPRQVSYQKGIPSDRHEAS
jgi:hypothetical protein